MMSQPKSSICQSCGMLISRFEDFGTNDDGSKNEEYCNYCFKLGKFTEPDINVSQKIDNMVKMAVSTMNMKEDKAREMAEHIIPKLKRWQTT